GAESPYAASAATTPTWAVSSAAESTRGEPLPTSQMRSMPRRWSKSTSYDCVAAGSRCPTRDSMCGLNQCCQLLLSEKSPCPETVSWKKSGTVPPVTVIVYSPSTSSLPLSCATCTPAPAAPDDTRPPGPVIVTVDVGSADA